METKDVDHFISVKLLRLAKPLLKSPFIVTTDSRDLPENILNQELLCHPGSLSSCPTLSVGRMLQVPQTIGNIYLGEVFSICFFAHNDSSIETAKNVSVDVQLQTALKRITLTASDEAGTDLDPQGTLSRVLSHEITELGVHVLTCDVSYADATGKPYSLKKFYRFLVLKPLDVQTKFYNAESDEVFLEAQIQNLAAYPINLEKVALEPSKAFTVQSMSCGEEMKPGWGLLQPMASRQFVYCLSPINRLQEILSAKNIGIIDIVWRSYLGDRGHLQTSELQRMAPDYGDLRLTIVNIPSIIKLEEPFTFICQLFNLSKRTMDLKLTLEKTHSDLMWIGTSGRHIGVLEPLKAINVDFTVVPLSAGLHSVSGIRICDEIANKVHEYDDLTQIFVT